MSTHRVELRRVARDVFGWDELHPDQLEAMEHVMEGRDVLAVLPTGAGKSAIYQVPALLLQGPTLVVSPLLALQRDQLGSIEGSAAPEAVAVNSSQRSAETRHAWEAVGHGDAEYLFLSPEQLAKDEVVDELSSLGVSLFVVDEAHCVSAWGHDFRPDYLRLRPVIDALGHPPVMACTATATPKVAEEIVARLGLREPERVRSGFDRPNLSFDVIAFDGEGSVARKRALLADGLAMAENRPAIVYCGTRRSTEEVAEELGRAGLATVAYHAG